MMPQNMISALELSREKLPPGHQRDGIDFQIKLLKTKQKFIDENRLFDSKISKNRRNAKIKEEQVSLDRYEKIYEADKKKSSKILEKINFLNKKLYFLKNIKDANDEEEELNMVKTTGEVKIEIVNLSVNPNFKCTNVIILVDSEIKSDFKYSYRGEFIVYLTNSVEFEIIGIGEDGMIIGALFFPCESFIRYSETKKNFIDLKNGFIEANITFKKKTAFIRQKAEVLAIIECGHILETYKSYSPFYCCICIHFTAFTSSAYRCKKCKFTCHKQCAKFMFFTCLCADNQRKTEPIFATKSYNILHSCSRILNIPAVNYCHHCGERITLSHNCLECSRCKQTFHENCLPIASPSCCLKFETRCILTEFKPPPLKINVPKTQTTTDNFEFIKLLGRGSFGKVFLVKHKKDQKFIALKILKKESIIEANDTRYIELERKVLEFASLSQHPFLMSMSYCFQDSRFIFFGTEFISGGDLFHHAAKRDFTHKQIKLYAAEIFLGIQFLHANNIIYRDLKLDNVMVSNDGHIKIGDYGLCKDNIGPLTNTYTLCGTIVTMAPEVIKSFGYTKAADWWSFGIILYEMFEGELPFDGATQHEIVNSITNKEITFQKTPYCAKDLICKLLVKDPKQRIGYGLSGTDDIKSNSYFNAINWDDVYNRKYIPPFIPKKDLEDNFDEEFIEADTNLSPCNSVKGPNDEYFINFK